MELQKLAQSDTPLQVPSGLPGGRARVIAAFEEAFELIGGIPRLAAWAETHPTEFFKIYSRLASVNVQVQNNHVTIVHALRPNRTLDGEV